MGYIVRPFNSPGGGGGSGDDSGVTPIRLRGFNRVHESKKGLFNTLLTEEAVIDEVAQNPSAWNQFLNSEAASRVTMGFEAEMVIRNLSTDQKPKSIIPDGVDISAVYPFDAAGKQAYYDFWSANDANNRRSITSGLNRLKRRMDSWVESHAAGEEVTSDHWKRFLRGGGYRNWTNMSELNQVLELEWPYGYENDVMTREQLKADFQNSTGYQAELHGGYHSQRKPDDKFVFEFDSSISPRTNEDMGQELVSYPMPLPQALEALDRVFAWANEKGYVYTNSSTGFHINVGMSGTDNRSMDQMKLLLLLGDRKILSDFQRESNSYCKSMLNKLDKSLKISSRRDIEQLMSSLKNETWQGLRRIANRYVESAHDDEKYVSVNFKGKYIEFRSAGGNWMNKQADLRNTVLRVSQAYALAADPVEGQQDYLKKAYRLLSSMITSDDRMKPFIDYNMGQITASQLRSALAARQSQRTPVKSVLGFPAAGTATTTAAAQATGNYNDIDDLDQNDDDENLDIDFGDLDQWEPEEEPQRPARESEELDEVTQNPAVWDRFLGSDAAGQITMGFEAEMVIKNLSKKPKLLITRSNDPKVPDLMDRASLNKFVSFWTQGNANDASVVRALVRNLKTIFRNDSRYANYRAPAFVNWLNSEMGATRMSHLIGRTDRLRWPHGTDESVFSRDQLRDQFESATGYSAVLSSGYHSEAKPNDKFVFEFDGSIQAKTPQDLGQELVSYPMPLPQAMEAFNRVFSWAKDSGYVYTNSSTGFHINVGMKKRSTNSIDKLKLLLLMGDEAVLKEFGRMKNEYCESMLKRLRKIVKAAATGKNSSDDWWEDNTGDIEHEFKRILPTLRKETWQGLRTLANSIFDETWSGEKYVTVNVKDDYIEFRGAGGNWLKKWDEIYYTVLRTTHAYTLAADPVEGQQDYMKKVYKIMTAYTEGKDDLKTFIDYSMGKVSEDKLKAVLLKKHKATLLQKNALNKSQAPKSVQPAVAQPAAADQSAENRMFTVWYMHQDPDEDDPTEIGVRVRGTSAEEVRADWNRRYPRSTATRVTPIGRVRGGLREASKLLGEVADQPYRYMLAKKVPNARQYIFQTDAGTRFHVFIQIEKSEHGTVADVGFADQTDRENPTIDVTGKGDAFRVFATVGAIVKEYVNAVKPDFLSFNGKTQDPGRIRLYDMIAKNIGRYLSSYQLLSSRIVKSVGDTDDKNYVFQKVAESVSEVAKVKLSSDPNNFGAWVNDSGKPEKTIMIPINKLSGFEPDSKFDDPLHAKNLANIVKAIKAGKELPPILVRRHGIDRFQVLDGHHRFKAYRMAGMKSIPARLVDPKNVSEEKKPKKPKTIVDGAIKTLVSKGRSEDEAIADLKKEVDKKFYTEEINETLKKVNGKWALVSRQDPSKVLQYYHGAGHPSKEWVSKVERRVHSFSEDQLDEGMWWRGAGKWFPVRLTNHIFDRKQRPGYPEIRQEEIIELLKKASERRNRIEDLPYGAFAIKNINTGLIIAMQKNDGLNGDEFHAVTAAYGLRLGADQPKILVEAADERAEPKPKVFIDMDGVLADFFGEWAKLEKVDHYKEIVKKKGPENMDSALDLIRNHPTFWTDLPLLPHAKELVRFVKENFGQYYILSKPLEKDTRCEAAKRAWIRMHFQDMPPEQVLLTADKARYAMSGDVANILIDDYGVNINHWREAGGVAFKYEPSRFAAAKKMLKGFVD
jgi:5'(3')-deoxyribonucleotidase